MDLGFLLNALIPSWNSVTNFFYEENPYCLNTFTFLENYKILLFLFLVGCCFGDILCLLSCCWIYITWKTCSRSHLARWFSSPLPLQWSFYILIYFRAVNFDAMLFVSLIFFPKFWIGLLALLLLVGLLVVGSKMNFVSPTVCIY